MPISQQIVDRYLQARQTSAARCAAHGPICFAARGFPERFEVEPSLDVVDTSLLSDYLQHLCVTCSLHRQTCEALVLSARRIQIGNTVFRQVLGSDRLKNLCP
jgi:hypothetical protein